MEFLNLTHIVISNDNNITIIITIKWNITNNLVPSESNPNRATYHLS